MSSPRGSVMLRCGDGDGGEGGERSEAGWRLHEVGAGGGGHSWRGTGRGRGQILEVLITWFLLFKAPPWIHLQRHARVTSLTITRHTMRHSLVIGQVLKNVLVQSDHIQ